MQQSTVYYEGTMNNKTYLVLFVAQTAEEYFQSSVPLLVLFGRPLGHFCSDYLLLLPVRLLSNNSNSSWTVLGGSLLLLASSFGLSRG